MKREVVALLMLGAVFAVPSVFVHAQLRPNIASMPSIFMYHEVMDIQKDADRNHAIMSIRPEHLERQFKLLSEQKYNTMFVSDMALAWKQGVILPDKSVALTFDDGTQDVYDIVLPLIKKYNIKITVFANPGFNGTNGRMTHEMLKEIHQSGLVEIGAHTMTHERLTRLTKEDAWDQIKDSKTVLEYITGAPVTSFAYPFGQANLSVKKMVRRAGFVVAFAADDRFGRITHDMHMLPRIMIGEKTSPGFFSSALQGW